MIFNLPSDISHVILTNDTMRYLPLKVNSATYPLLPDPFRHEHIHDYVHIWFVVRGKLILHINKKEYALTPGMCVFIAPFMHHDVSTAEDCGEIHIICLSFHDSFLTRRGYNFFSYHKDFVHFEKRTIPLFFDFKEDTERATEAMLAIEEEFNRHSEMSFDALAALTADFFRLICAHSPDAPQKKLSYAKKYTKTILRAIDYINLHRSEKLTIDKLCEVTNTTRRFFTKRFAEVTGMPCAQFIFYLRLASAVHFLAHTTKTAGQISEEVGFVTSARLTHVFKERLGITPSQFRLEFQTKGLEDDLVYWKRWTWFRKKDFKKFDIV